ncbi:hypothetical protein RhiirA4_401508 [Rhizophagus irregularis]|uniref:Transposase putative helix-turn-helix domain-containing protein n=1 Tax=Rhizophagus irregularis TaxID=588596 RepID=A0A2I1GG90_9GLOM|nr:hypothetical protein RhiirA4_401508 [Rhizophagus irregularis]
MQLLYIYESVKTGEISKKRKVSAIRARQTTTLGRNSQSYITSQSVPNHSQKQLLKRWMGLARFAYNSVIKWNKRCYFTKEESVKKRYMKIL